MAPSADRRADSERKQPHTIPLSCVWRRRQRAVADYNQAHVHLAIAVGAERNLLNHQVPAASPAGAAPGGPQSPPSSKGSMFTALSERDYVWYFSGNLAFFMAIQMQLILRGFVAFDITGAATALGLISASVAVPMLIGAPIAGTVADRVNKRTLLMVSQTGSAATSLLLAVLLISGTLQFWHLLSVSVLSVMFMSFNMPARQAIVPQLVPQHKLMNAISLQQAGMNATRIVGPALGGVLIAPLGAGWVYMITVVLLMVAVASELHLPVHGMKTEREPQKFRDDFLQGFKYVNEHRLIAKLLFLSLLFPLFAFPLQQMLPVFARDVFGRPDTGLGLLAMSTGIGGLSGAMLVARLHGFPMKGRLMLAGGLSMGLLFIGFTQTSSFIPALIFLGLGNIGGMVFQTTNNSVIQAQLPAEIRGRVMSMMMMSFGLMPLGVVPVTIAADAFGAQTAVLGSSLALVATVLLFFAISKTLRTLRVDQLAVAELSPARAATLVAQGKLTQAEADRLTGTGHAPAVDKPDQRLPTSVPLPEPDPARPGAPPVRRLPSSSRWPPHGPIPGPATGPRGIDSKTAHLKSDVQELQTSDPSIEDSNL